ncbi:transcriptional regulator [Gracilinema caldarium]|uniref:TfoX domain-containing protein n=1 Tax=Gracilinema caldarium (strain ATCC 51460 / DSM 7334 / H1) TaxID=744872 RepID=F8F2Z1_GRAC1|nr:transcriptional regulator [Gracilinema caldarium]AEJ19899.1 TfoX domain-containing protein [Gracilinema caldarium DSM 7334]AEJ19923.1 TfoX domain-containing protein [Gracilinema caldarium DSM 7334]
MSTTQDFIEFLLDQIDNNWNIRYRKMFGEYMVYINDKPILLVCDNTVFVKELDCIRNYFSEDSKGFPYKGSKEHFILDIENKSLLNEIISILEKVIPIPIKKAKKNG